MASPQSPAVNSTDVPSTPPHPAGMPPPAKCRSGEEGHCLAQLQCTQQAGDRLADLAAADHSRTMLTTPHSYPVSNHRSTVRLKNKLLNPDIYCSSRWRGLLASPHLTAAAIFYKAFLKPISSTLSSSKTANLLKFALIFLLLIAIQPCQGLRCYTDVKATKSQSVECGLSTGCIKIFIDSKEMLYKKQQDYGYVYGNQPQSAFGDVKSITLPPRYQGDPVLLRGCFVLAVPDRCYMAKNGLSYCWCSQKDLCNSAPHRLHSQSSAFYASLLLVTLLLHFKWCNGVC